MVGGGGGGGGGGGEGGGGGGGEWHNDIYVSDKCMVHGQEIQ